MEWVPKSILREAREKEVKKLQQFETYEEVPLAEAEGQEIMSSRFVDKWEENGELRSRLVSRGNESSHTDPASLFAAAPSAVATRIGLVLGLAQDVEMAVTFLELFFMRCLRNISSSRRHLYRKTGVVWKIKRYLYGDKRAPRGWQDHFEKTMLELGFGRLESEPGCFVKKGVTHKDTIIVVVHVDDLLSVGKRKHLDNFFVQLEKTLKLKHVEFIEHGKSVLFLGDYITKFKDKITLNSNDTYMDNMLTMLGMESCKPTNTPMVRKESVANDDKEMLEGSEAEAYRSVVGILMYSKRHRFDLHYAAKSPAMASSSPTKGHMRRLKRVLRYIQSTRDMHLELVRPREKLTELVGWCDGSWADLDEKRRSTTGGLLMLGGPCVADWSRTQKPTALSSGESEFYSATVCACELLWACEFLRELGYTMTACLKEDTSACIGMATR